MNVTLSSSSVCKFCDEGCGKYTCPRCNVYYCSVTCYRSPQHSECSEAFYKECVVQEMNVREPDPQNRIKMLEILKRNYEEAVDDPSESEDSDDETALAERLRGIDLDDPEQIWTKLTAEEQKDFLEMANAGDITKLVPLWNPWWSETHPKSKVTFVDASTSDNEDNYKILCPKVKSNIPPIQAVTKSKPSPLVFNNLVNFIASYSMTTRFLNGEHSNSPGEASSLLLDLSKNLSDNVTFDTLDLAIESVSNQSINNQIIGASVENINQMRNDVAQICLGPNLEEASFYVLAALTDASSLFQRAARSSKNSGSAQSKTILPVVFEKKLEVHYTRKQMMMADKKIQYYLSWVVTCYSDIIDQFKQSLSS